MTQKDKLLLLKDLCARLPYGVMIQHPELFYPSRMVIEKLVSIDREHINDDGFSIEYIKPYLRPMSSMTEEEKEKLKSLYDAENVTNESICFLEGGTLEEYEAEISFVFCYCVVEWLLKNHFDFNGLIPKGLAIEAPEGMYN